jgi:hypothetical protein
MAIRKLEEFYQRLEQRYRDRMPGRKPGVEDDEGWKAARRLLDETCRAGRVPLGGPVPLHLEGGEGPVGRCTAVISRYDTTPGGSSRWTPYGDVRVVLTDRRVLCEIQGTWHSFRHGSLLEVLPDLRRRRLTLGYDDHPAVCFQGPWVPWLTVGLAGTVFGVDWLGRHPDLDEFRRPDVLHVRSEEDRPAELDSEGGPHDR